MNRDRLGIWTGLLVAIGAAPIAYMVPPAVRWFVSPLDIWRSLLFSLILFLIVAGLGWLMTRRLGSAGLIGAVILLGALYPWPIFLIIFAAAGLSLAVCWLVARERVAQLGAFAAAISVTAVIGFYIIQFGIFAIGQPWDKFDHLVAPVAALSAADAQPASRPDIYYIILDGYGRADVLQRLYRFDNSAFLQELARRGFVVADHTNTNYPRTMLSLSSSLNMQYLDVMSREMDGMRVVWPFVNVIHQSQVRRFLEQKGYATVSIVNGWQFTDISDVDSYLEPMPVMLSGFDKTFATFTNLRFAAGLQEFGVAFPSNSTHRNIILAEFELLPEAAAIPGPKFVFMHILGPHSPFVFDAEGGARDPGYAYALSATLERFGGEDGYRSGYVGEVQAINRLVLAAIDAVLKESSSPPIIILQGDHGPAMRFDTQSAARACLGERYPIFNAYLLPGGSAEVVYPEISPVNSFRMIFNKYFDTQFERLADVSFFAKESSPYQFEPVTVPADDPCTIP